ncbi:ABC transporter permease [Pseudoalteromonas luteoviolacea]|uniref:ABC transporter permease n=1 Tax=Pseudoalteromonas luteoviolacea TaxID=43657 RepID=UPI001F21D24B|nr:ABC transporter permease [Pseudoalteromonas luteoviolacea]MCF6437898.1 ABC transporter permease [Pseudoalteromonas luteoviolacea]
MLQNYFLTTIRAFKRQKSHILLNVVGMTIGLSAFLLMYLFVSDELTFDRYHPDYQNTYRIASEYPDMGLGKPGGTIVTPVLPSLLKSQFSEQVNAVTQIGFPTGWYVLRKDTELLPQLKLQWADEHLFEVFSIPMIEGLGQESLRQPNKLIISRTTAQMLYGKTDVVGETLKLGQDRVMEIGGVFEDLPGNTHLDLTVLASLPTYKQINPDLFESWTNIEFYTYVNLKDSVQPQDFRDQINQIWSERNEAFAINVVLQPLADIYLNSDLMWELKANGSIETVYLTAALALFLLLVACFNFINMSTARAGLRAKEIGIRKILGAKRKDIVIQFLAESVILVALATIVAVILVILALPTLNEFTGKTIGLEWLTFVPALSLLILAVGMLAGMYPAFYMSSYNTLQVLSGNLTRGKASARFRKVLVIFQTTITVIMLVLSTVVYMQINHSIGLDMGYEKDDVIIVRGLPTGLLRNNFEPIANLPESDPRILSISTADHIPTMNFTSVETITADGRAVEALARTPGIGANYDLIETMGMEIVAGRGFTQEFAGDWVKSIGNDQYEIGVIINQTAAKAAGWNDANEAIGKTWNWRQFKGRVVGVVKDVQFLSDKHVTSSFFMGLGYFALPETIIVKTTGEDTSAVIQVVESKLNEIYGLNYFDTRLLSQEYSLLYKEEEREKDLLMRFAAMIIFITCLGLIGLSAFSTERRQKELAIRKVIGARRFNLVNMLCNEFLVLGAIASVIAWPIAYYLAQSWLEVFTRQIDLSVGIFVAATFVTCVIIWLTVAILSYRACSVKPTAALRSE